MSRTLNIHLKPLRQGDLDGLCGVYAILNALQWLLPKARDTDYLTKLFDKIIGAIYTINNVKDGGEEPELRKVFQFIKERVLDDFGMAMEMTILGDAEDKFKRPDQVSTPEQKCVGWPEQKYIGDAGRKAPNWGPFLRASGLGRIIHRGVSTGAA